MSKEECEEKEFADYFYEVKRAYLKQHPLRFLFFEVTSRCNAHCEHCGSSCGDFIPSDEITADEIKKVLKEIADNKNYDPKKIMLNITGGEPLVRKDLFEIMKYAHDLGYRWGMVTNGILIDEKMVKKMAESGIFSVSVSIDGLEKTHESFRRVPGSFKKIIKGIKLMLDCPAIKVVQTITCVNKKNIDQLEDIYQLMLSLGIKEWRIIEVDPIGRAKDNKDLLLDADGYKKMYDFIIEKRKRNDGMNVSYGCGHFLGIEYEYKMRAGSTPFICSAGISIGCILSNGDIFVCPDVERRPELIQGNIRKDNFIDVWENKFKPYRKLTRTSNSKCKNCPDWKLCTGDAFHTWDFDTNKPRFCAREVFFEDYKRKKEKRKTVKLK